MYSSIIVALCFPLALLVQSYEHADIQQYPYAVSVENPLGYRVSGGVIISQYYVLSENEFGSNYVYAGDYVRYNSSFTLQGGSLVEVARVYVHPGYDSDSGDNDTSVIEVSTPFIFDDVVQPAFLPDINFNFSGGLELNTVGWSYYSNYSLIDEHLVAVNVTLLTWDECESTYYPNFLSRTSLCVICTDAEGNACLRDGGAALVTEDNILLGVYFWQSTLFGIEPAIYTNVTSVLDFVRNITTV